MLGQKEAHVKKKLNKGTHALNPDSYHNLVMQLLSPFPTSNNCCNMGTCKGFTYLHWANRCKLMANRQSKLLASKKYNCFQPCPS